MRACLGSLRSPVRGSRSFPGATGRRRSTATNRCASAHRSGPRTSASRAQRTPPGPGAPRAIATVPTWASGSAHPAELRDRCRFEQPGDELWPLRVHCRSPKITKACAPPLERIQERNRRTASPAAPQPNVNSGNGPRPQLVMARVAPCPRRVGRIPAKPSSRSHAIVRAIFPAVP